ncbi:MAG: GNAT family N-acetyltransferase [Robiginitomaculum sp.]|nr:GNAT family N-acetyltransferase [Robiginitomaculum sp.]
MKPDMSILQTRRMVLRAMVESDANALFQVFCDPVVCKYWSSSSHNTIEQTKKYIQQSIEERNQQTWVITLENNEALGWIYLGDSKQGVAELGFILHRDHWGKGLVSEAAATVIAHGFETRKLRRIFADVDPDNTGSKRVVEKLRFQFEGVARANWETHIGVRDSLIYGLIATDEHQFR